MLHELELQDSGPVEMPGLVVGYDVYATGNFCYLICKEILNTSTNSIQNPYLIWMGDLR